MWFRTRSQVSWTEKHDPPWWKAERRVVNLDASICFFPLLQGDAIVTSHDAFSSLCLSSRHRQSVNKARRPDAATQGRRIETGSALRWRLT